jgi:hypothetical protein
MRKPRKPPPPLSTSRIIHIQRTSDFLDYIGRKLEKQAKGEPVLSYLDDLQERTSAAKRKRLEKRRK